jgi:TolB-like protein/Tfp pilus assembly protein PilF/class 3 adenylate cyclase/tRNA A-37 threonylcarbamoyl transferase component Bud32
MEIGQGLDAPGTGGRETRMTAERWQQIKAIFDSVVECDPPARAEFLRQRCGSDGELQREVESLLASYGAPAALPERPIVGAGAMAAAPVLAAPLVLKDRYEVDRELGRGGMSVVYLARDRELLAKRVVVKVLLEETSQDAWIRQKFQQEMEALARIDHPGVVGVLDSGLTAEGQRFLVMQYIEGVTLRNAIEPGGMNFVRAAGLIRQIGQALAAAHEKGVWHRDLKPENVMLQCLGGEDHVKLIDFGIAGIQNSQFTGEKTKVAGSFNYMAPEQMGGHPCAASDTYALGVVAYEILTGELPEPTGGAGLQLPERARRSIRQALSLRPEARQSSAREFSEELYHALTGGKTARESAKSAVPGTVEMAHVLFTDLVGYSLLPMDRQKEYLGELQQIVRESPRFRAAETAGDIISLPTGDGMALAFFGDPTAPAQCALDVAAGLKSNPHLKLRMGIHSGPVYRVADVNANANVAGGGINMAQRVMDCGDAGHILVSKTVADVLLQLSQWSPHLTNLGECTVKHGVKIHLYNLATAELGNRQEPHKLAPGATPKARSRTLLAVLLVLVALASAGVLWMGRSGNGSAPAQEPPSIAVLPFVDRSPEKNQEYFSEGIAEQLLNSMARIDGLRVVGMRSSFKFKGTNDDFRSIGKKLSVASILEGSVSKQGDRARINVQLIKASDGFNLWSDTYDREMSDIFAVQDSIATAVTEALKIKLLGKKGSGRSTRSTNADAYNAYLQGRYFLRRNDKEGFERAVDYFEQAIKMDPGYAPAWVGIAEAHTDQFLLGHRPTEEGYQDARQEIESALVLDPNLGDAYEALGRIKQWHDWDWAGADAAYQRALVLAPGKSSVISNGGKLARILGRFNEAAALLRRAIQIDPLDAATYHSAGIAFYYAGLSEEATAAFRKALDLVPEREQTHSMLAEVYLGKGQAQEALVEARQEKNAALQLWGTALAYHALGQKTESEASLAELIARFGAPFSVAEVYAFRGETERAFERLEHAYTVRDSGITLIKDDPLLNSLKGDPRYTAMLKKMRLPL